MQGQGQAAVRRTRGLAGRDLTFWEALLTKAWQEESDRGPRDILIRPTQTHLKTLSVVVLYGEMLDD